MLTEREAVGAVAVAAGVKLASLRASVRRDTALVGGAGDEEAGVKAPVEFAEAMAVKEAVRAAETGVRACTTGSPPLVGRGSAFRRTGRDAEREETVNGTAARFTLSLPPLSALRDTAGDALPNTDGAAAIDVTPLKNERLTGVNEAGKAGGAKDEAAARAIQTAPAEARGAAETRDTEATGAVCTARAAVTEGSARAAVGASTARETLGPSKSETSDSTGMAARRRRTKYGVMLSIARCIPARYRPVTCAASRGGEAKSGLRFIVGAVVPIARIAEAGATVAANGVKAAIGGGVEEAGAGGIKARP